MGSAVGKVVKGFCEFVRSEQRGIDYGKFEQQMVMHMRI